MDLNLKNYLNLLNKKQHEAVTMTEGPCLILAGAGSGKTRVLTIRILHILLQKKAYPGQILAVTFTNKAANEMKTRVANLLNRPVDNMWIGTFHSLCAKILRQHCHLVGLKNNFIILDSDDQLKLIKQICESEKIDTSEKSPKYFLSLIDNFKNKGIAYNKIKLSKFNQYEKEIKLIYKIYQEQLIRLNCVDFGDLILHCINIFKKEKDVCLKYQKLFKYILVDEYQDINKVQQLWLEILYEFNSNICCVGDDDQSIYSWRGADVTNLLNFEKNFSKPKIIRLEQNYRSTKNILDCASSLINQNKGRFGKKLWSDNPVGDKIFVSGFWETKEEALYVSDKIEKLISKKVPLSEISILFRVAAHTRSFEDRFINIGLPYKIIGGLRFYERKEIKDVIAYLRLVNNLDDNLAFERIINVPKRGIGKISIKKINALSRENDCSMFEAAKIFIDTHSSKSKQDLSILISKILKWHQSKNKLNHIELVELILEDSKYIEYLEQEEKNLKNPENLNRIDNIKEFIVSLKDFNNLEGFLEHVSLIMENISVSSNQTLSLMTMHSAKGLEFDHVFLAGWEEGVFPSLRSIEELGKAGLEEERRLAYVALTRARKKINITYVNQNRYSYASHDFNTPSRFIDELPKNLVEINDSSYLENNKFISDFVEEEYDYEDQISPGRKRLINYYKKNQDDWDLNQDYEMQSGFEEGSRVFHQKFGYGKILFLEGDKAEVEFKKSSKKMIFIKYLQIIH
ncbi:MAG: ATP-dependent DNA helicase PcrA [Alphaproteobacteria bacterium MarineAlpha5_Bin6]|nr:MAG: ATP-dependent DNA helicase PcrA [Alphaproteobacteria bacterium MarineAlpha5_Bin7]PPR53624.1 MAG: ATP-dependent DNA helicase PcrA [Alphaproteobacteria bacterium MarineAlpha5_Bin6]|tara:strand:- start:43 stop:2271 length:2229 start_codon:yes stop_codon:yes gene_type:complete